VSVSVQQSLSGITVSPASASVLVNGTQQFTATTVDQFGLAMSQQPTAFGWNVSGGGSISPTGLFTAGAAAGGPFTVTATSSGLTGTASVSVTAAQPITVSASANPNPVSGKTTALSATATDPNPGATITSYAWSVQTQPSPNSVSLSSNAQNVTATFYQAGSYTFQVIVADSAGATGTATVAVTVNQVLTSITVTPQSVTLAYGARQQFTARTNDQFGNAMSTQPSSFTWTISPSHKQGGGNITSTGLYTAPSSTRTVTVKASASGKSGTGTVIVVSPAAGHSAQLLQVETPPAGITAIPPTNIVSQLLPASAPPQLVALSGGAVVGNGTRVVVRDAMDTPAIQRLFDRAEAGGGTGADNSDWLDAVALALAEDPSALDRDSDR
jgi:hypothetical protein